MSVLHSLLLRAYIFRCADVTPIGMLYIKPCARPLIKNMCLVDDVLSSSYRDGVVCCENLRLSTAHLHLYFS